MATNIYKAKNGSEIKINLPNKQENDRPFKYICLDADLCSDLAVSTSKTEITTTQATELIKLAISEKFNIPVENINFTRVMTKTIRNIGISAKQLSAYKLMMETPTPVKTDIATPELKAVDSYITELKTAIAQADIKPTSEQILAQIQQLVPQPLQTEVFKAITTKTEQPKKFSF